MPFLPPHKHGPHRTAAIALFRALLMQCRALALPAPHAQQLQNVVRNRFKQVRHMASPQRLMLSFEAGYQAIDVLDAAVVGDAGQREHVMRLLGKAPERVKADPPAYRVSKRVLRAARAVQRETDPADGYGSSAAQRNGPYGIETRKSRVLVRPLPLSQLSGRRRVPILVSANQIPILRLSKPQPAVLSRMIDSKIKKRQARLNTRERLGDEMDLARWEDAWDGMLEKSFVLPRTRDKPQTEPGWTNVLQMALDEVHVKIAAEKDANRIMATKMQEIVDREQELAIQEKAERKRQKHKEWKARQSLRKHRTATDMVATDEQQA